MKRAENEQYATFSIPINSDTRYYVSVLLGKTDLEKNDPHAVNELIQVKMKNAELLLRDLLKKDGYEIPDHPLLRYE